MDPKKKCSYATLMKSIQKLWLFLLDLVSFPLYFIKKVFFLCVAMLALASNGDCLTWEKPHDPPNLQQDLICAWASE